MKRIAVMQPYFLPYLGYWQLLAAVDRFVVLDDVNFRPRAWINRNRMLNSGRPHWFTIPLIAASQNRLICELELVQDQLWRERMLRSFRQSYSKAPELRPTMAVLERVMACDKPSLSEFLLHSLQELLGHLLIETELVTTSRCYGNAGLRGEERLLDICRREGASHYLNAPGGRELYSASNFCNLGVSLEFLEPKLPAYSQGGSEPIPGLSIIDTLMFNNLAAVRRWVHLAA